MIFNEPDKYERWAGIENVRRRWTWNNHVHCWYQRRNYDLEDLTKIYHIGYRSEKFRGETIDEAFDRLIKLPYGKSENKYRVRWFLDHFSGKRLLDIGAGIGVFPWEIRRHGWDVEVTEENLISINFLRNKGFTCYTPEDKLLPIYDVVSIIHVLEHIEQPSLFLEYVSKAVKPNGSVFIEVPDAVEFDKLPEDSDEFNSCHIWFFDVSSLYRMVIRHFDVTDVHRVHHGERNRWRIMLRATAKS